MKAPTPITAALFLALGTAAPAAVYEGTIDWETTWVEPEIIPGWGSDWLGRVWQSTYSYESTGGPDGRFTPADGNLMLDEVPGIGDQTMALDYPDAPVLVVESGVVTLFNIDNQRGETTGAGYLASTGGWWNFDSLVDGVMTMNNPARVSPVPEPASGFSLLAGAVVVVVALRPRRS